MTPTPTLACPSCKRTFAALEWIDAANCRCRSCLAEFNFVAFPALTQKTEVAKPQAVTLAEESTCFFHGENQAEKVCDDCGRFLCAVCAIPMSGRTICPTCISSTNSTAQIARSERTIYGGAALALAVFPILVWPVTLLTAPAAIALVIYGWNKPTSLVQPRRWSGIVAVVLGALQVVGWGIFFVALASD